VCVSLKSEDIQHPGSKTLSKQRTSLVECTAKVQSSRTENGSTKRLPHHGCCLRISNRCKSKLTRKAQILEREEPEQFRLPEEGVLLAIHLLTRKNADLPRRNMVRHGTMPNPTTPQHRDTQGANLLFQGQGSYVAQQLVFHLRYPRLQLGERGLQLLPRLRLCLCFLQRCGIIKPFIRSSLLLPADILLLCQLRHHCAQPLGRVRLLYDRETPATVLAMCLASKKLHEVVKKACASSRSNEIVNWPIEQETSAPYLKSSNAPSSAQYTLSQA
jgi:hypothetical protein